MASRYDLLFEQWKATLAERDRRTPAVQNNFEELFDTLRCEGLVLESAYEYLPKALKAHSPSASLVKTMFKKLKASPKFQYASEREFEEQWVKDIGERANIAFFNIFPLITKKAEEEDEPPLFGSMTAKEYKAQREHADSWPRLSPEDIRKHKEAAVSAANYNPMDEINSILGKDNSGNSN